MIDLLSLSLSLILLLLSDCHITPKDRVYNRTGQQCVWCTLESQARHWGYTSLFDLTTTYTGRTGEQEADYVLLSRGFKTYVGWAGSQDWASLENASRRHWPTSVAVHPYHMVLLIDVTPTTVTIIDNGGDKALEEQVWPRSYFASIWTGWFITLPGK